MREVDQAAILLAEGGLVAFPTETVYGLGADATDDAAVAKIYAAKQRPRFNPLILHVADAEAARAIAHFEARADALAERLWPGPLTLVLPRRANAKISSLALAGLDTVALRVPGHPIARAILTAVARPIAAPSANRSGRISPTTAAHVAGDLGDAVDLIVDGGACPVGLESTILDLSTERACLLRPGGITRDDIESVIGSIAVDDGNDETPKAPGRLARHYAPRTPLQLNVDDVAEGEALLAFGPPLAGAATIANLSPEGDLVEAAANLFAMLHELDASGASTIAVMPIPDHGLGAAINDRLRRAAAD
jgi:L-threonylcarbamoyladenylate synthase